MRPGKVRNREGTTRAWERMDEREGGTTTVKHRRGMRGVKGGVRAGGKRTGETLHSVAPWRVENAALCWGSLHKRGSTGLKEKKALVRLRWRRFAHVKPFSHDWSSPLAFWKTLDEDAPPATECPIFLYPREFILLSFFFLSRLQRFGRSMRQKRRNTYNCDYRTVSFE